MNKNIKKHLALLLCLMLCLSLFPAAGFAEGGEAAAGEITVGEQVPAEEPEEAADADVVEEEEGAADAETEQVVPEEPEDVLIEDDADKAISAEAEEPEEDAERKTGSTEQVEGFVRRGYSLMLGRDADADGLRYYVDLLTSGRLSGAQMVSNFMNSPEFSDKKVSNEEAVTILYRVMMNREPDPDGLAYHTANLDRGLSYNCIINGFSASEEFAGICAESGITPGTVGLEWRDQNPLVTDFVNRNYLYALERKGEGDGLNYYCQILLEKTLTPQQVAHGFVFSPECVNRGLSDRDFIAMLYHLYMGREADEGGMNYYLNALSSGTTRETVAAGFAASPEFADIVASYGLQPEEPTTEEFVVDGITYEVIDSSAVRVRSYDGAAASVTIPQTVEGYTVVEIGTSAFEGNQALQSIDLPDSILVIGRRAFKDCTNLRSMS